MIEPSKYASNQAEVVVTDIQPNKQITDADKKPGEDIIGLPAILPELDIVPNQLDPDIKRLLTLCWLGYSTAVYARDNRCSPRQKRELSANFVIECNEALHWIRKLSESFEDSISAQDQIDLFKDFERFRKRLIKLVEDSISNNSAGFSYFYYLFFHSLTPLKEKVDLMSNVVYKNDEKALIKDLEIRIQAEQEKKAGEEQKIPPVKKLTEETEKIELTMAKANIQNWRELSIAFIGEDTVRYTAGKKNHERVSYIELGFKDKKKCLPDKNWEIFRLFAELYHDGYVDFITSQKANRKQPHGHIQAFMKCKDRINRRLKDYFGPQEPPIRYVKKDQRFRVEFALSDERPKQHGESSSDMSLSCNP